MEVLVFCGSFNTAVHAANRSTSNNKMIGNNETQQTPLPSAHETKRVGQNCSAMRTFPNSFLITSGGCMLQSINFNVVPSLKIPLHVS